MDCESKSGHMETPINPCKDILYLRVRALYTAGTFANMMEYVYLNRVYLDCLERKAIVVLKTLLVTDFLGTLTSFAAGTVEQVSGSRGTGTLFQNCRLLDF